LADVLGDSATRPSRSANALLGVTNAANQYVSFVVSPRALMYFGRVRVLFWRAK
jgi:hypothetical protein